jgi:hypothetical protein
MKKRLDSLLFKILITIVLLSIPGAVYYQFNFESGVITALSEIIFLIMATREDVIDLKEKK